MELPLGTRKKDGRDGSWCLWEMNLGFSVIKDDNKIESMTVGIKRI